MIADQSRSTIRKGCSPQLPRSDQHFANCLLLPVETIHRELDGKILLSLFAAERGFRTFLGFKGNIDAPGFPPSFYISKSVRRGSTLRMMKGFGHRIAALDEEGLVRFRGQGFALRLDADALNLPEILVAWGRSNADDWRRHVHYRGTPICEAGNPRIDLLRAELRSFHQPAAQRLREQHGRFVLFNTNFAIVNHFIKGHSRLKAAEGSSTEAFSAAMTGIENHKRQLLDHFRDAIPKLAAAVAPHKLIVRPHPSEDPRFWHETAKGIGNITVTDTGEVIPWLLAAACLLHNGCTTAVESAVLGTPTFAYRPVRSPDYDLELPNAVSTNVDGETALISCIKAVVYGRGTSAAAPAQNLDILNEHIASLDGAYSCERILDALTELRRRPQRASQTEFVLAGARYGWRRLKSLIRPVKRQYDARKFPDISADVVNERIARFKIALNRFEGCSARPAGHNVFLIEKQTR
ncbi:MAG: hypothetical protein HY245_13255 [Rhizobiales bacterium]|nr:hypothetical protein [Hyphomicrobiales bacterium]